MSDREGSLPVTGQVVHMQRARSPVTVSERLGEGGQGVVYRAQLTAGATLALKWYRPTTSTPAQRRAIADLVAHGSPHPTFCWPLDLVSSDEVAGWGYVMPLIPPQFSPFAQMLNEERQPSLRIKATIGRKLAEAFVSLHASGLCYRDLNFGNLYVDRQVGNVAVCDNDNVGTDSGHIAVYGTLRFMAPEIVRRTAMPTTVTDLHSLAVMLFYLLMHGHPLDGRHMESSLTWEGERHLSEEQLALKYYGQEPLFVFDPDDDSNRPVPGEGDRVVAWWSLCPGFLRQRFTQAFTTGLTNPSLSSRVTAETWRKSFVRLADSSFVCPDCSAERYYDPAEPSRACWHCGKSTQLPFVLELPGHRILLDPGATLTDEHLRRNRDCDTDRGRVERHPRDPRIVVLRNVSEDAWTVRPDGEDAKSVRPNQAFAVRPATIRFGSVEGVVRPLEYAATH